MDCVEFPLEWYEMFPLVSCRLEWLPLERYEIFPLDAGMSRGVDRGVHGLFMSVW